MAARDVTLRDEVDGSECVESLMKKHEDFNRAIISMVPMRSRVTVESRDLSSDILWFVLSYKDPSNVQAKHQKQQAFEADEDRIRAVIKIGENQQCAGRRTKIQRKSWMKVVREITLLGFLRTLHGVRITPSRSASTSCCRSCNT
jgi:hypothetical protein